MTERKQVAIFTTTGTVMIGVEVDPHEVRIYDVEGDISTTLPVPLVVGGASGRPPAEPLSICFRLATQGADHEFDRLGMMAEIFKELDARQCQRALSYLAQRFDPDWGRK